MTISALPRRRAKEKSARPSLREEQRGLTRRRLLDAARELFYEQNYVLTTVDDIAARAGVGRATFYLHYSSKEALIQDLWSETLGKLEDIYRRLAAYGAPTEEQLVAWVSLHLRAFRADQSALSLFYLALAIDTNFVAACVRQRDRHIAILGQVIPAFNLSGLSPKAAAERRIAAHLLFYQIEQFCFHMAFPGFGADAEIGCRLIARNFRAFIDANERAPRRRR